MTMSRFKTLLQREWLQHRMGYFWLAAAPAALMLAVIVFGWKNMTVSPAIPLLGMSVGVASVTALTVAVVCIAVLFQMPGLARRDQQDRSIEFWSSLPVSHSASLGATLLFHGWLVPLATLGFAFLVSQVLATLMVTAALGAGALGQMPWGTFVVVEFAALLRFALGLVLAACWIAPIPLVLMVASATMKHWGVPVVTAVFAVGAAVLTNVYGNPILQNTWNALFSHAGHAFVSDLGNHHEARNMDEAMGLLAQLPVWALGDAGRALADLVTPAFAASLAVSAACFAALVELRRRSAAG
jgi:hypothetical protein